MRLIVQECGTGTASSAIAGVVGIFGHGLVVMVVVTLVFVTCSLRGPASLHLCACLQKQGVLWGNCENNCVAWFQTSMCA